MTFDATGKQTQLTEERVTRTTEYMHKDMPDGTEVCLLKYPLSVEEWNQILQNQKIVVNLLELQDKSQQSQDHMQNVNSIIEFGENKIKKIHRRVLENEVKLESIESQSNYDYKDLLKESNEAEKEHEHDLRLLMDLLCKYKIIIK